MAACEGNNTIVALLVEAGAKLNEKDQMHGERTALFFAVEAGDEDMTRIILDGGATRGRKANMNLQVRCVVVRVVALMLE